MGMTECMEGMLFNIHYMLMYSTLLMICSTYSFPATQNYAIKYRFVLSEAINSLLNLNEYLQAKLNVIRWFIRGKVIVGLVQLALATRSTDYSGQTSAKPLIYVAP